MLAAVVLVLQVGVLTVMVGVLMVQLASGVRSIVAGAPFVPIGRHLIGPLLTLAAPGTADVFYDVGCGDGRVLEAALRDYNVSRAVGYDVGWWPLWWARRHLHRFGLGSRVILRRADARTAMLSDATIVYLYLFPKLLDELAVRLGEQLAPGARILCPSFPIDTARHPGLRLLQERKVGSITAYLYTKV